MIYVMLTYQNILLIVLLEVARVSGEDKQISFQPIRDDRIRVQVFMTVILRTKFENPAHGGRFKKRHEGT